MDATGIALTVLGVLLVQPALNHFWTILQILRGFFREPVDLKKKYGDWALVTGCTDGIGKAFSLELAKRGLNIVLVGRNKSKLDATAGEIQASHRVQTKIIIADFAKGREIYKNIADSLQDVQVGILVNNVGIQYTYPMYFGELPEDELWDQINVNIGAVAQMTRLILPGMKERNRGAIINVSSASKLLPLPFMNMYASSKVYMEYFTEALRAEYKNTNLTIQLLCPFYVSTKINHFSTNLRRINMFIPDSTTYAESALGSLGVVDNTSGYWPHRLQLLLGCWVPVWVKMYFGRRLYKLMRNNYLKSMKSN